MSDQPRIVLLGDAGDASKPDGMQSGDAKTASDLGEALAIAGENAMPSLVTTSLDVGRGWLDALPDGIAVVRNDGSVVWANAAFLENFASAPDVSGRNFFDTLGVERPAANASPFGEGGGRPNRRYPSSDGRHFELHVGPSPGDDGSKLALVHDVTDQVRLQQKREAIHRAGFELGDIRPDELVEMNDGERIELLKSKIEHYVRDLLEFETAEIRLLEESTGRLRSLLAMGMTDTAEGRELVVSEVGNGVTGYVAATGRSYRCSNTRTDPNYIEGAEGALSSLTVPIHFADEFLGTFNVESPAENAFDELDEEFLTNFGGEVAVALHTLDLLGVEKESAATTSSTTILREVAGPVDLILADAAWVHERYLGLEPEVCNRINEVLKNARDIKQLIRRVGESMRSQNDRCAINPRPNVPELEGLRVLVVDGDEAVRRGANDLLCEFGCEIETAHDGEEALLMARSFPYDIALVDIRLPDLNGYECFTRLREISGDLEVMLMTGFGYDAGHSIVKARQAGLKSVLYKPFRREMLLAELRQAVTGRDDAATA